MIKGDLDPNKRHSHYPTAKSDKCPPVMDTRLLHAGLPARSAFEASSSYGSDEWIAIVKNDSDSE